VRNFSPIHEGDPYSAPELEQFVRRLNASGYFASVHATIDPDPAHADSAPVRVSVIEGPTKKLEFGVGYSTDTEFRGNLSYSDVNCQRPRPADVHRHALRGEDPERVAALRQPARR
jgi:translocation and assembly module TamA